MEELVELGPGSEVGRGLLPLSRDSRGVFVSDPSPKSLRLRPGDRVLAARVSLDGATPEAVWRLLEGAGSCRVSLYLRRASPGNTAATGTPSGATGTPPGATGTAGTPEGQRDRLPTPPPAAPVKKPKPPGPGPAALAAGPLELALPKLPKLAKPLLAPRSPPARPRLTVRQAAAAARAPQPPKPPQSPLTRLPPMEVAAPKGSLGLSPPQIRPPKPAGGPDEEGASRGGFRVPSLPIDAPKPSVELGVASPEPPSAGPDSGVSKFPKLEPPAVEIAPKPPKFRLPRLGWALGKFREGAASPPAQPPKVPKLSLAPFGDTEDGARFGFGGSPRFALPKFGGSSPDLRPKSPKFPPKRGGSAESLTLGWTAAEPLGTFRVKPKFRGVPLPKSRGVSVPARISIPELGFALPGPPSAPERPEISERKVPVLELAPPGLDGTSEPPPGRRFGVKLPKFGAGSKPGNPRRRWEPPKFGKIRFPDVELCPGDPQISGVRCHQGEGTPKFQLPQLVLSPQICGEP